MPEVGVETASACAAAVCAGTASWLLTHRDGTTPRARLLLAGGGDAGPTADGRRRDHLARWGQQLRSRFGTTRAAHWWCLPLGAVVGIWGRSLLPPLAGVAAMPLVGRWLRGRERRYAAERRAAAVAGLCAAVSAEVRTGQQPEQALLAVGTAVLNDLGEDGAAVLAAARYGTDMSQALRQAAQHEGAEALRGVAACWQVAVEGGTGLADGLDRLARALRAENGQREDLRAQLAGPRATALVLALLPGFGLLLGSAMGAEPLRVLLHTPAGLGCLLVGGLLESAGLVWVTRLVRGAEQPGGAPSGGAA